MGGGHKQGEGGVSPGEGTEGGGGQGVGRGKGGGGKGGGKTVCDLRRF